MAGLLRRVPRMKPLACAYHSLCHPRPMSSTGLFVVSSAVSLGASRCLMTGKSLCKKKELKTRMHSPKTNKDEEEEEDEDEEEEEGADEPPPESAQDDDDDGLPKDYQSVTAVMKHMRLDNLLKDGFQTKRATAEQSIMEGKVRVNGRRVFKKSADFNEKDTVDVFLNPDSDNPDFSVIHRLYVAHKPFSTTHRGQFSVKVKVWRKMIVDDFPYSEE